MKISLVINSELGKILLLRSLLSWTNPLGDEYIFPDEIRGVLDLYQKTDTLSTLLGNGDICSKYLPRWIETSC